MPWKSTIDYAQWKLAQSPVFQVPHSVPQLSKYFPIGADTTLFSGMLAIFSIEQVKDKTILTLFYYNLLKI